MKKLVSILLILAMMLSGATALAATGFEVPAEGYDGSEVTITFYHTIGDPQYAVLKDYIAEFEALYPNIHVVESQVGGYDDVRDQVSTELGRPGVGTDANIAYCYPDHVALYNLAHAVQTLDELIDSKVEVKRADGTTEILGLTDEQKADFIEGYYEEGRQFGDGKMYTMPFSKSTEVLYYNKTFFDANNLTVPTTWDEMEEVCAKIKEITKDSEQKIIPLGYDASGNWFITLTEQMGSGYTSAEEPYFLFNNEENRAMMWRLNGWYQKGYVTTKRLYGAYTSNMFKEETSYMSIGSSAGAIHQRPAANADGSYPFEVGIASIPQIDPANPKVISQGPSVCIFKKANPQEVVASWLFVKFLITSVDFQAEFSNASGYTPVIKSVTSNEAFANALANADGGDNVTALSAKICLKQADAYYTSPAFVGSSTARDQVDALLDTCLTAASEAEIEQAFDDALEECEYSI